MVGPGWPISAAALPTAVEVRLLPICAYGKNIRDAAIEAAHLRLRPILMTSFAFILGVLPLVIRWMIGRSWFASH